MRRAQLFPDCGGGTQMTKHEALARANFLEGYNCAQAVLLAFAEDAGLEKNTALR